MSQRELILNPYLSLKFYKNENGVNFVQLSAPKKNVGREVLELTVDEEPELYELFSELSQTSLNFLDVEEDLTEAQRERFYRHGILLESGEPVSRPPLFACYLDEIADAPEQASENAELIINPTFRLEADIDYSAVMQRRAFGFEPQTPVVWIRDDATGITLGYWVRGEFVEILKKFVAGSQPENNLTPRQTAILSRARILIAPDANHEIKLDQAAEKFHADKFVIVRDVLPDEQLAAMRRYLAELRAEGFMVFRDKQVGDRYAIHNDAMCNYFHQQLADLISRVANQKVIPSYVYAATYRENAVLKPHTDRPQCEFTMSMQIGYEPALAPDEQSPWALCVDDESGKSIAAYLANGDGFLYKGCELVHYRNPLFAGHQSTSIFFHFVPEDFEGSLD